MYSCECKTGYTGLNCEDIYNACELKPCKHNTKCTDLTNGDYKCDCDAGYSGKNCEIDVDNCVNNQCANNSTCLDGVNSYKCQCKIGYTGQYCDIPLNPCNSLPCMFNSTCKSTGFLYYCECRVGYTGRNCEIKFKPCEKQPCGLYGDCVELDDGYKCMCRAGYTGKNCLQNLNECDLVPNVCWNNATCVDLDPSSNKMKFGYFCDCSSVISGKYAGQNCSIKLDLCLTSSLKCRNNSTCVSYLAENNEQDFYCECKRGFAGKFCEFETSIRLDSTYFLQYYLNKSTNGLFKSFENVGYDLVSLLNDNYNDSVDHLKLKFDFKIKLHEFKNNLEPLISLKLMNNMTIELVINNNFIEIYLNSQLNEMNLPFLKLHELNWHSIEIFIKLNFIQITYKTQNFSFNKKFSFKPSTNFGSILSQHNETNNNLQLISFSIGKYLNDENENYAEICIRDLKMNDYYMFLNDSNVKYGCTK